MIRRSGDRVKRGPQLAIAVVAMGLLSVGGAAAEEETAPIDCLIEPWAEVEVSAAIEGLVEEILVERGDHVTRGQTLARLESEVERSLVESSRARAASDGRVRSAKARLDFARSELGRIQNLGVENVVSASALDESRSAERVAAADLEVAENDRQLARLDLARAKAALARRHILSPVDGVVIERMREPGEYADPPQILRIAQVDPLRVEVFAPLDRLGEIEVGTIGWVEPEAPVTGRWKAVVHAISPVVDAASGTFEVSLELANPDHRIPAGLNCRLSLETRSP